MAQEVVLIVVVTFRIRGHIIREDDVSIRNVNGVDGRQCIMFIPPLIQSVQDGLNIRRGSGEG